MEFIFLSVASASIAVKLHEHMNVAFHEISHFPVDRALLGKANVHWRLVTPRELKLPFGAESVRHKEVTCRVVSYPLCPHGPHLLDWHC